MVVIRSGHVTISGLFTIATVSRDINSIKPIIYGTTSDAFSYN